MSSVVCYQCYLCLVMATVILKLPVDVSEIKKAFRKGMRERELERVVVKMSTMKSGSAPRSLVNLTFLPVDSQTSGRTWP